MSEINNYLKKMLNTDTVEETNNKFKMNEIIGNLFESKDSLCHCVSEDLSMSAGIAVPFKNTFKRVDELKQQGAKPGEMCYLFIQEENRYIYYLVTKSRYFHKPTYEQFTSSVTSMKEHMLNHNVKSCQCPE